MEKTKGHLGQKIERKKQLTGYEMTDEYRDTLLADIKSDPAFALSISKIDYNADTINLIFNSLGGIIPAVCEKIITLCNRHKALFYIVGTETQGVKVVIFKRLSNAI